MTFSQPSSASRTHFTDSHTLTLYATQTDYTLPAGDPLFVASGLGGTVTSFGDLSGGIAFQAYADSDNNALGLADFTNGPQNAVFTLNTFDTGTVTGVFDRDGDYSLTSVVARDRFPWRVGQLLH